MVIIYQKGEEFWIERLLGTITFAALDTETDSPAVALERAGVVMSAMIGHQGNGSIGKRIFFSIVDSGGGSVGQNEYVESVIFRGFQGAGATAATNLRVVMFMQKRRQ